MMFAGITNMYMQNRMHKKMHKPTVVMTRLPGVGGGERGVTLQRGGGYVAIMLSTPAVP